MRPVRAPRQQRPPEPPPVTLRSVANAAFLPAGKGYLPRQHLRHNVVALRGGEHSLVLSFTWQRPRVHLEVLASGDCSQLDIERAFTAARRLTAVDDDPSEFLAVAKKHEVLRLLVDDVDPRLRMTETIFEAMAVAILEQLVTGFEARKAMWRLWYDAGETVPGTDLLAVPTAAAVAKVPPWKLHELGVGGRRAVTLLNAAKRASSIERLRDLPPETFMEKLQTLPGIGTWTASYVARLGLGYADAVPVGDFWAPYQIAEAFGVKGLHRDDPKGADDAMLRVLEPFRPHRARIAMLIERFAMEHRTSPMPRVDPHRRYPWRY